MIAQLGYYNVIYFGGGPAKADDIWSGTYLGANNWILPRPFLVTETMVKYKDSLALDVWYYITQEPASPPEDVYWDFTYGVEKEGDPANFTDDPGYYSVDINAGDFTNLRLKRVRQDINPLSITGHEGWWFGWSLGRYGGSYAGNVVVVGMFIMKKGPLE